MQFTAKVTSALLTPNQGACKGVTLMTCFGPQKDKVQLNFLGHRLLYSCSVSFSTKQSLNVLKKTKVEEHTVQDCSAKRSARDAQPRANTHGRGETGGVYQADYISDVPSARVQ